LDQEIFDFEDSGSRGSTEDGSPKQENIQKPTKNNIKPGISALRDDKKEVSPVKKIESKEESKSSTSESVQNFSPEKKNNKVGEKIIEQLGEGYLEDQQKILNHGKSTLIFSKKTFCKKQNIKEDEGYEDCMKLLEANLGITPDLEATTKKVKFDSIVEEIDPSEIHQEEQKENKARISESIKSSSTEQEPELSDFVILKMLNKGGFGKVFLVKNTIDGKYYAMKRIRKDLLIETGQIENTMNEKTVLLRLQNPFLLGMTYAYQNDFRLYFLLDFIRGGDLYDNLVKVKRFTEPQVKFFTAQIVIALGYLHEHKIVHRDLKPENVLVKSDGYIVLADFGLAKIFDGANDMAQTMCGTPEYMAPEILKGKQQSYSVDWWTLGVLLYELATGRSPFKHKNDRKLRKLIIKGKFPWPDPERHKINLSPELKDLISKLLVPETEKRLGSKGVKEIMKHPWFDDIRFEDILQRKMTPPYKPEVPEIIEENPVLIKSYRKMKGKFSKKDKQREELLET
jgi:tRNA A-37 threonylcarbamoyl transferase component Bud32